MTDVSIVRTTLKDLVSELNILINQTKKKAGPNGCSFGHQNVRLYGIALDFARINKSLRELDKNDGQEFVDRELVSIVNMMGDIYEHAGELLVSGYDERNCNSEKSFTEGWSRFQERIGEYKDQTSSLIRS